MLMNLRVLLVTQDSARSEALVEEERKSVEQGVEQGVHSSDLRELFNGSGKCKSLIVPLRSCIVCYSFQGRRMLSSVQSWC